MTIDQAMTSGRDVDGKPTSLGLSLIMPCYNEEEVVEETIVEMLDAFKQRGHKLELIAVDNGSQDRTGEILKKLASLHPSVVHTRVEVNQGYGHGVLSGLALCTAPWVGLTCADGQVDPHDTAKLFEIGIRAKTPKLIKVRRRFRMDGFKRRITSIVYNGVVFSMFGGLGSIDINGNPKILPREYIERMNLKSRDWFLDAEIMIKAKRLRLPVIELNVLAQMREGGNSNVSASTCWEFIVNLLRYRFTRLGKIDQERSPAASEKEVARLG